jgi:mycofactocin glycosyltransferase
MQLMIDITHPSISVVIPVYNRTQQLTNCLRSVCLQSYPVDRFEILVIDDGSTEDIAAVVQMIGSEWSGAIRVIRQMNGGPASARNTGVGESEADIIAFIDSDCTAETDWLSSLAPMLQNSEIAGAGGPIISAPPQGWVDGYLFACDFFRHRVRQGVVDYLITISAAFRRAALLSVGGFTSRKGVWNEDADLSFRLKHAGYTLVVSQFGKVTHHGAPSSFRSLIHELYRYGRGNAILSRHWKNGRTPVKELVRHSGAAFLAPVLALRLMKTTGFVKALSYIPIIFTEHLAFCWGVLRGMSSQEARL